jgi:hypothetical protein
MTDRFKCKVLERVFLIRWFTTPEATDVDEVVKVIADSSRSLNAKMHYVEVVGENLSVPTTEGRKNLKRLIAEATPFAHCAHTVIEGTGTKSVMLRTVISATTFLTRTVFAGANCPHRVHGTAEAALTAVMLESKGSAEAMIKAARASGVL